MWHPRPLFALGYGFLCFVVLCGVTAMGFEVHDHLANQFKGSHAYEPTDRFHGFG